MLAQVKCLNDVYLIYVASAEGQHWAGCFYKSLHLFLCRQQGHGDLIINERKF